LPNKAENNFDLQSTLINEYDSLNRNKIFMALIAFILLFILIVYSTATGALQIPVADLYSAIMRTEAGSSQLIIWNIRLPRVVASIIAGGGLAVAGMVMQSILKNPLGSPFTLGISQAAGFGAAFSIIFLGAGALQSGGDSTIVLEQIHLTTLSAFAWSMIATGIIILLVKIKGASPETMILTGVALGSLFTAGTTALQYIADDVELSAIVFWTFGDVGRATWQNNAVMLVLLLPALIYFALNSWNYKLMASGDETAKSLGVPVDRVRILGMLIASLITAVIISFVGIIGFIGLVAPHIGRKIIGPDEKFLIPFSTLVGSILLLAADTAARTILAPIILPVGILTSFLGVPLFLYLVLRGREYMWS